MISAMTGDELENQPPEDVFTLRAIDQSCNSARIGEQEALDPYRIS